MARRGTGLLFFLAGAATGLLMSPNTGRANRAKIRDKVNHFSNELEDFVLEDIPRRARYYQGKLVGTQHRLEQAIAPAWHMRHRRLSPDDISLTDKIKSKIGRPTEEIDDSGLNINTVNRVVFLRGMAHSQREKRRIERIARMQPETAEVINELKIAA